MSSRLLFAAQAILPALFCSLADAQTYDILERSPQTSIYLETDYVGNDGLANCDWYSSAEDFLSPGSAQDFGSGCRINLRIRGIINRDGAALFSETVDRAETLKFRVAAIVLDSRGGDADAAISMAKLIRQSDSFRKIPVVARVAEDDQSVCFSACVVLFSAAYQRELEFDIDNNPELPSRIGIHGPGQFDRARSQYDSSAGNTEIARVSRRLKDYFRSIEVNEALVDDMFAVPFDQIRLLSRDELVNYGLYAD
ncbi:MAG: hypothetical protein OEM63_15965 [Gammaproteobacteria bacterium]|nr:hypothetical protein [Gammaproteobacteria bacterium]